MCAIAGILRLSSSEPVAESRLRQMLAMVRHRGPDQFGIYQGEGVGLGNARLSIIDLGGGQQPISNEDQTIWIVFNGEIFNYVELRADLEAKGHHFSSHTDTEVIVHAYEEYGVDCLSRLNGDFAFAIWNEVEKSLFLGRDRVGVRPLFYTVHNQTLYFASEIKSILANREVPAEIDPVSLDQIFTFWSTLSPRTCFKNIYDVPAGHFLICKRSEISIKSYWNVDFSQAEAQQVKPTEDYTQELDALLSDATKIRLRADVPVGAYLSGGLDSSILSAIIRNLGVSRLETFSIAFSDPKFDESEYQKSMADFLGTQHQVVYATHSDIGKIFPQVVWHTETPIMRTSPAPMFLLSKLVRNHNFKVVLTGEGADEFFAGYDIFKEAKVRRFWAQQATSKWRPSLLKRLYPEISNLGEAGGSYLSAFFGAGLSETKAPDYSHAIRWRNNRRTTRFFSEDLNSTLTSQKITPLFPVHYPSGFSSWNNLEQAQFLEASIFLSQYLLSSQGDRVGMGNSVEGRFPFLDFRVMEFGNRLPPRLKLRGLKDKYLLRKVGEKYLPKEIFARRKRPYRAPIHRSFFNDQTEPYVHDLCTPEMLRASGLFKEGAVTQLIAKLDSGKPVGETDDMALVGILSTQLVFEKFIKNFALPSPLGGSDDVKVVNRSINEKSSLARSA